MSDSRYAKHLSLNNLEFRRETPNIACTRQVGLAAFSGSLRGWKLVSSKWRCLLPPGRLAQPCRDPWVELVETISGYPAESMRGKPQVVGRKTALHLST
jgi:hypothetical protein